MGRTNYLSLTTWPLFQFSQFRRGKIGNRNLDLLNRGYHPDLSHIITNGSVNGSKRCPAHAFFKNKSTFSFVTV